MSQTALEQQLASADVPQPSRELLAAWLLLLLHGRGGHGYDLQRRLRARGVATESGAMYRALRKLESDGHAESSWGKSVAGPPRRLYGITASGRRELESLVETITAKRDVHAAFIEAHDEAHA